MTSLPGDGNGRLAVIGLGTERDHCHARDYSSCNLIDVNSMHQFPVQALVDIGLL